MIGSIYIPLLVPGTIFCVLCLVAGYWKELTMHIRHHRLDRQIKRYYQ